MKLKVAAFGLALASMAAPAASWGAEAQGDRTAVSLAAALYGPAYKPLLRKALVPPLTDGISPVIRPEWRGYVGEAVDEELDADAAALSAILGQALARTATHDELAAGLAAMRDPAIQAALKAASGGSPPPGQLAAPSAETQAVLGSPAGRAFSQKVFSNLAKVVDPVREDLLRTVMPGIFRRLGQKAGVAERRRLQDEALPVEAAS